MKRTMLILGGALLVILVVAATILHGHQPTPVAVSKIPRYALISLGDSVAAGDGLAEGSTSHAVLCHQSIDAYPYIVAQSRNMQFHQFACSGAQVSAGILQNQTVGSQVVPAQLSAATPYIHGNDVVIMVGANDVGWDNFLTTCAQSNCVTQANLASFQAKLTTLQNNLDTMLQGIAALHPHHVLLNTYYSLVANTDTCLQQYGITTAKIQWVNDREVSLNAVLVSEAQKYHDKYATVTFAGHGICSSDPWIQGLSGTAPLHPNTEGQYNIATLDEAQLP
jgi:lysophospholipase L1-like esterase